MAVPTINITLSDTSAKKIGLNPYGLAYEAAESDVAISVSATAKAVAGSEAVLATAPLKGTETTKSVFAFLELKQKTAAADELTTAPAYDAKAATQVAFSTKGTTKKDMVTLPAGDSSATYAGYKIFGDVASKPAKAWAATDTVDMSIVFQFDPVKTTATP